MRGAAGPAWGRGAADRGGPGGGDRKTARRYVAAAGAVGLCREDSEGQLTDELIGAVVVAVRPSRPSGHGQRWEDLLSWTEQILRWGCPAGAGQQKAPTPETIWARTVSGGIVLPALHGAR